MMSERYKNRRPKYTINDRLITTVNGRFYGTVVGIEGPLNGNEGTDGEYDPYFRYSLALDDMDHAIVHRVNEWHLDYLES